MDLQLESSRHGRSSLILRKTSERTLASVADCAAGNVTVRRAASDAFAGWTGAVAAALRAMRVPYRRAEALATLMISALEGALLMARAERDPRALDVVVEELGPLLDGGRTGTGGV